MRTVDQEQMRSGFRHEGGRFASANDLRLLLEAFRATRDAEARQNEQQQIQAEPPARPEEA